MAGGQYVKRTLIIAWATLSAWQTSALALPPGRGWLPASTFSIPGHSKVTPEQVNIGSDDVPWVVANVAGGIGRDVYGLRWADSTWAVSWQLGRGTFRQW